MLYHIDKLHFLTIVNKFTWVTHKHAHTHADAYHYMVLIIY